MKPPEDEQEPLFNSVEEMLANWDVRNPDGTRTTAEQIRRDLIMSEMRNPGDAIN